MSAPIFGDDGARLTPTICLEEAAKLLRYHPDTVRKMTKARELPGTKVGCECVFYTESLLEWLKARCESLNPVHEPEWARSTLAAPGSICAAGAGVEGARRAGLKPSARFGRAVIVDRSSP